MGTSYSMSLANMGTGHVVHDDSAAECKCKPWLLRPSVCEVEQRVQISPKYQLVTLERVAIGGTSRNASHALTLNPNPPLDKRQVLLPKST